MNRADKHKAVCDKLREIYVKKNRDYGNSFDVSVEKFGPIAFVVRVGDKMQRLEQLIQNDPEVTDESFNDTVSDMVNYGIMFLMRGGE